MVQPGGPPLVRPAAGPARLIVHLLRSDFARTSPGLAAAAVRRQQSKSAARARRATGGQACRLHICCRPPACDLLAPPTGRSPRPPGRRLIVWRGLRWRGRTCAPSGCCVIAVWAAAARLVFAAAVPSSSSRRWRRGLLPAGLFRSAAAAGHTRTGARTRPAPPNYKLIHSPSIFCSCQSLPPARQLGRAPDDRRTGARVCAPCSSLFTVSCALGPPA
jgi:hypothetical protein